MLTANKMASVSNSPGFKKMFAPGPADCRCLLSDRGLRAR